MTWGPTWLERPAARRERLAAEASRAALVADVRRVIDTSPAAALLTGGEADVLAGDVADWLRARGDG